MDLVDFGCRERASVDLVVPHFATVRVQGALHAHNLPFVGHSNIGDDGSIRESDIALIGHIVQNDTLSGYGFCAHVDENGILDVSSSDVAVDQQRVLLRTSTNFAGERYNTVVQRALIHTEKCAHSDSLEVLANNFAVVVIEILHLAVIPPERVGTNVYGTENGRSRSCGPPELRHHCTNTIPVGASLGSIHALLSHEANVAITRQRHWHPEVRISVEFAFLSCKLGRELLHEGTQNTVVNTEGS
mmetsp:Transcript_50932/g.75528  ORF Transcript_50932/g.75528 Transcript_50932/m.75528 type:complete len:245 (+) Transcript_50932:150-884(+)